MKIIRKFVKFLEKCDTPNTYGSALERYIVSKQPKSTGEIEFWVREFDRKKDSEGSYYGR